MSKSSKPSEKPKARKTAEMSELARIATRSLAQAQRQVARENARYGLPLIVVEKGRIVEIPTGKDA